MYGGNLTKKENKIHHFISIRPPTWGTDPIEARNTEQQNSTELQNSQNSQKAQQHEQHILSAIAAWRE